MTLKLSEENLNVLINETGIIECDKCYCWITYYKFGKMITLFARTDSGNIERFRLSENLTVNKFEFKRANKFLSGIHWTPKLYKTLKQKTDLRSAWKELEELSCWKK